MEENDFNSCKKQPAARRLRGAGESATPASGLALKEIQAAAQVLHVRIRVLEARRPDEVLNAMDEIANDAIAGVVVVGDPLMRSMQGQIGEQALKEEVADRFYIQGLRRGRWPHVVRSRPQAVLRPHR